jgi:hypothetical protein
VAPRTRRNRPLATERLIASSIGLENASRPGTCSAYHVGSGHKRRCRWEAGFTVAVREAGTGMYGHRVGMGLLFCQEIATTNPPDGPDAWFSHDGCETARRLQHSKPCGGGPNRNGSSRRTAATALGAGRFVSAIVGPGDGRVIPSLRPPPARLCVPCAPPPPSTFVRPAPLDLRDPARPPLPSALSDALRSVLDIEPEMHHIPILHHVLLPLHPHLPRGTQRRLAPGRQQI